MNVYFYKPDREDLWFRRALLADSETMQYNRRWGGTVAFPQERWDAWYAEWVEETERHFYRYVTVGKSRMFVGEAAWHQEPESGRFMADVLIRADYRRRGCGQAAVALLCNEARKRNIPALYDSIAEDNPGIGIFLRNGFTEESREDGVILIRKDLQNIGKAR